MIKCRYCRKGGFRWKLMPLSGWRLITADGELHICEPGLRAAQARPSAPRDSAVNLTPLQAAQRETSQAYHDDQRSLRGKFARALLAIGDIPTGPMRGPEFQFEDVA